MFCLPCGLFAMRSAIISDFLSLYIPAVSHYFYIYVDSTAVAIAQSFYSKLHACCFPAKLENAPLMAPVKPGAITVAASFWLKHPKNTVLCGMIVVLLAISAIPGEGDYC